MTQPSTAAFAYALLAALASCMALGGVIGHAVGVHGKEAAVQAERDRQADAERKTKEAADRALAADRADAAAAVAQLRQQLEDARLHDNRLQEQIRHAPLTVPRACPPLARAASADRAVPRLAAAAAPASAVTGSDALQPATPAPDARDIDGGGPGLTLAAVSLWNSALAGVDVPAGACGPADAAEPACAAAAGLGLADAWSNHVTNARLCAADRARHQALIDYLDRRQRTLRDAAAR